MQLGRALRALYAAATELATLVHAKAATLSRVLAESKLGGVDGLAARKLSELRRGLEETAELLESLRTLERAVARLQGQVKGLERVGAFLSASVFSFAIESVRTTGLPGSFWNVRGRDAGIGEPDRAVGGVDRRPGAGDGERLMLKGSRRWRPG